MHMGETSGMPRRSALQAAILLQLAERPADSVADLARRMGVHRPSVSRSLHLLAGHGLVEAAGRGWRLSPAGEREVAPSRAALDAVPERVAATIARGERTRRRGGLVDLGLAQFDPARHFPVATYAADLARQVAALDAAPALSALAARAGWIARPDAMIAAIGDMARVPSSVGDFGTAQIAAALAAAGTVDVSRVALAAQGGAGGALAAVGAVADSAMSLATLGGSAASGATLRDLTAGVGALLDAQGRNGLFAGAAVRAALDLDGVLPLMRRNNLLLAKGVDDLLALQESVAGGITAAARGLVDVPALAADLGRVAGSVAALFRERIPDGFGEWQGGGVPLAARLAVPVATAVWCTGVARDLVAAETVPDLPPLPAEGVGEDGDSALDPLLAALDRDFVEQRRGAWWALRAGGPDRLRHAGASMRALFQQLLELLAPNEELPEDNRQGTQTRARARLLLGGKNSDAAFVEAAAVFMQHAYEQLCKYDHRNMKHEEAARGIMHACEGAIRLCLASPRALARMGDE